MVEAPGFSPVKCATREKWLYSLLKNSRSCEEQVERTFRFASKPLYFRYLEPASAGDRLFLSTFSANRLAPEIACPERSRRVP